MDLLIGADLRKYRKAIQKSQQEFAKRMGVSQATLSLIEVGKLPLSTAHLGRLEKEFNKPSYAPKFADFVSKIEEQRRTGQALVGHPEAGFMTVPVYEWEENFDLSAAPASLGVKGMVTVRSATPEIIAFEMPSGSVWWVEKETLVFARCGLNDVKNGELCLVQLRMPRTRTPETLIAVVRFSEQGIQRATQLEPADQNRAIFTPRPDQVEGCLRCIYRARYVSG